MKADAHGDAVVKCQTGNGADGHGGRQPAASTHGIVRDAPQRRHSGKEQEQHKHDRGAQQRHRTSGSGSLGQGWFADGHVGVDQGGQQAQQGQQHGACCQQRLRVEEVGEQGKETEEKHHKGIASGTQLEHLERQQHDNHGDAGVASEQGLVTEQGCAHGQREQTEQPPARGQGPRHHGKGGAPQHQ